jgi:anhydro-N-acetylmuramic acid kinase
MNHTPQHHHTRWSLGIMSGTSLDAIDLALLHTDGETITAHGACESIPFPNDLRNQLRGLMEGHGDALKIEQYYTSCIANAVNDFLHRFPHDSVVLGFHGQTIIHRPLEGLTWQLGNTQLLSEKTGRTVVADFRRRDMAAGGQGAPLVPLYHAALARALPKPLAIVNIGGVANVTWMGRAGEINAFDTGTGNALINDWVLHHTGEEYDENGKYASLGVVHSRIVAEYLSLPYFSLLPPKSLDRNSFLPSALKGLSLEDGAATLTEMTAASIAMAQYLFPEPATQWLICGGGRHNLTMMQALCTKLPNVQSVEAVGWRGDVLEAEAFAYLAVRSLRGLPISLPTTTGVRRAVSGGVHATHVA